MYLRIRTTFIEYPYSLSNLLREYGNVSFPKDLYRDLDLLSFYGVYPVVEVTKPEVDPKSQKVVEVTPVQVDGEWRQAWEVQELSPEEKQEYQNQKSREVRAQRLYLLQESDWTQFRDIPEEVSQLWAPYRQALRDVTAQPGFPFEVQWPQKPE
jgi:metal-sulfur cluster biosynthetic enzyme